MHRHRKTAWSAPRRIVTQPHPTMEGYGWGYDIQERRCMNGKCNKIWRRRVMA